MAIRAILLVALAAFLFAGIVCADDALKLPGSTVKTEDIALKCDAVFVGKITDAGVKDRRFEPPSLGPELLHGVKVNVSQLLRGSIDDLILVTVHVNSIKNETPPKVGNSYIFFVTKMTEGQFFDPVNVLQLLPATDENIATIKKLISN